MKDKDINYLPLSAVLNTIVDNRGKTVPTSDDGIKLIATNCISNDKLFPVYEKVRYVSQDTYDNWFRSYLEPGDIIFVNKGIPGKVCMVPDNLDFCIAQDMVGLRVNKSIIYNRYLFAYLRSKKTQDFIKSNIVGSLIPHFKKEQFKSLMIPIIPMKDQIKIGNLYYMICYKEELNNKINKNLHEICNELYNRLVSKLDDSNSKLLFVKEIAKCVLGGTPSRAKKEYWGGDINWINSGEINKFRIIEPSEKITELGLNKSATTLLPKKTTVLAITGATLGQVSRLEIDSCANQSVIGIIPDSILKNNYIYLSILNNIDDLVLKQTGGAQQHINKTDVETHKLVIPNDELLKEFDKNVSPLFDQIAINCFENKKLEQLRVTLLPKLMNGEIDLDNIEI